MAERADLRNMAAELRDRFNSAATELDKHAGNVNIARVAGGVLEFLGGVTAILGILSDPVPERPSAALTFGIVGGTVGGLVSSVAKITESVIENQKFRDLAIAWDLFCELVQVQKTMEQADKKEEKVIAGTQIGLEVARDVIYAGVRGGAAIEPVKATVRGGMKRAAVAAGKTMHRAAKGSQKYAAAAAVGSNAVKLPGGFTVLNVVTMSLGLYDIIDGFLELHRKKKSKAGDVLRRQAQSLDHYMNTGNWS